MNLPASCDGGHLKPGDRVTWLRSPGHSILSGWKVQAVSAEIVRICRRRVRLRVRLEGREKIVIVDPENVIVSDEAHK